MRFSLRWLFVVVLIAALSCGALVNSNVYWAALAWTVSILLLAAAAVSGIHHTGKKRAFWFGVAGVGWMYLSILSFTQFWFGRDYLCDELCRSLWDFIGKGEIQRLSNKAGRDIYAEIGLMAPPQKFFDLVIKCLVTGLVALSGGLLARWFYGRRAASK